MRWVSDWKIWLFAGAPLHEILAAAEWSSPAFMKYINLHSLERDLVVQSHCEESDDEVES